MKTSITRALKGLTKKSIVLSIFKCKWAFK